MRKKQRHGRLQRFFRLFLLLLIIGVVIFFATRKPPYHSAEIIKVIPTKTQTISPTISLTPFIQSQGLQTAISAALSGTHGTYGIVVKNLKTGETYYSHQTHVFEAGSLYKLWVMAAVFDQIQNGSLKQNTKISESVAKLNKIFDIDPNVAEKKDGTVSFIISDALYQMITISDNYAGLLLAEKVTLPIITSFLISHGFIDSKVGINGKNPVTTPLDIAFFLEKLYSGQLANPNYTNQMINLLKEQRLNSKIPKYLPDDVVVAHKTGELDNFTHDVGIVYSSNGTYILAILSESDSRDLAEERIADVSQAVYNYFTTQQ